MKRAPASLQARALAWLAQREQSRSELRRKLLNLVARQRRRAAADGDDPTDADADADAAAADADADADVDVDAKGADAAADAAAADAADADDAHAVAALAEAVDALLDRLQAQGLLSDERFIDSRVRARAAGRGTRRIQFELAQHDLKLPAQALQALRHSEVERALQLWRRKFGAPPPDARERARQMRFLAARGFSGETIRAVLAAADAGDSG
jgi:regulatory protein